MKYISKYSNDKEVSAAQFITELICEHKAKLENRDLHFRFWTTSKYWTKFYKNQIATANQLLKKYQAKAIISALNDKNARKIYSLRAPHLIAIIEQHESIAQQNKPTVTPSICRIDHKAYKSRTNVNKHNIITILDENTEDNNAKT